MRLTGQQVEEARNSLDPYITGDDKIVVDHPSYERYKAQLVEAGKAPAVIQTSWELLIEGFRALFKSPEHQKSEAEDRSFFLDFSEYVGEQGFLDTNGKPLALWSGGFDMSRIAQRMGYCTLEATVIGKVLDSTALTSLWNLESKLWNEISREFVERYIKKYEDKKQTPIVHVYFQTVDMKSVLERQELKQLSEARAEGGLRFHPIYLSGGAAVRGEIPDDKLFSVYSEVGRGPNYDSINLNEPGKGPVNYGITWKECAQEALQEKLRQRPYCVVRRAIESANADSFNPRRAPYATDY